MAILPIATTYSRFLTRRLSLIFPVTHFSSPRFTSIRANSKHHRATFSPPSTMLRTHSLLDSVHAAVEPLDLEDAGSYDRLIHMMGNARVVLIGEGTHGTHEFYAERARLTKRLIEEKGFNAVAVEADWPDAHRVNRFVRGISADHTAAEALSDFERFPTWMWRNEVVADFADWLRIHNDATSAPGGKGKAGFYGLDLYSMFSSMTHVIQYLDKIDPAAANRARRRYSCFDQYEEDSQEYGMSACFGLGPSCETDVINQLRDMQRIAVKHGYDFSSAEYDGGDATMQDASSGPSEGSQAAPADASGMDNFFDASENAHLVRDAEEYYRSMFQSNVNSWNIRDKHMFQTLRQLMMYLDKKENNAKIVVWAHNSHLGDARATDMSLRGELNLGQLCKEQFGRDCFILGQTTYHGSVTAAPSWGAQAHRYGVRCGLPNSVEELFHKLRVPAFMLDLRPGTDGAMALSGQRFLERAIGVIYVPKTERQSHYFRTSIENQFDTVLHFDKTHALVPLERTHKWNVGEAGFEMETYPSGL